MTSTATPITRVVLYKHGVGYFERQGTVEGDTVLTLTFKQAEVSDVLKSLTVLDLDGGHVASVSYDATRPLDQLLAEIDLHIPDQESLVGLLPQIKGARIALHPAEGRVEGILLGVDSSQRDTPAGAVRTVLVSLLTDSGEVCSFDLHGLARLELLDATLRRDLDFYLRTQLSAKKKDARTFSFFAQGTGQRTVRISYTLEAPVWKATYRIILGEENRPPTIQGWAVVDNTQDEDWENVQLSLVAGLPVSFVHDLYTPRYIRRPVVAVQETTGVLPPVVEEGFNFSPPVAAAAPAAEDYEEIAKGGRKDLASIQRLAKSAPGGVGRTRGGAVSSTPAQVRERKIGDLFEYEIEHPVTIRRNQSALVPIVLRPFEGKPVLLHNRDTRPTNPMRSVELKNTTGLTLEGGPVAVLEGGSYVGEAMLETLKPDEQRLVPYAVELSVSVLDNVESHQQPVHRVILRNELITTIHAHLRQTTYTFHNKGDTAQIVYLDHPREGSHWELSAEAVPLETTENYWRFRFTLPPRQTMPFVVRQSQTVKYSRQLLQVTPELLGFWIEQRYLDPHSEAILRQVLQTQKEIADLDARLVRLAEERDGIRLEQARIRENMQALGDRPAERELRERFVHTLTAQEDRLEQIADQTRTLSGERDQLRKQVATLIAGLEHETVLV
jgi:hypothetical protein